MTPLLDHIVSGNPAQQRRAMAKAITLLESTRADHRALADELLTAMLPHSGNALRLGISGVPSVGKSTFIEALGLYLIQQGHRVAVLAVDPSSSVSGGSILGDKTRMEHLSVHPQAYIRPSPSSGTLGGVAEKTRESMLVCEAAGYDVVLVETVGVGQSETAVANMTDMFCLLQLPNAGDDLQAIKKGVMELADLVVINKADIDPHAATRARAQIMSSLRLLGLHGNPDRSPGRPKGDHAPSGGSEQSEHGGEQASAPGRPKGDHAPLGGSEQSEHGGEQAHLHHDQEVWQPQVIQLSALKGDGVQAFWAEVSNYRRLQTANGRLAARRRHQAQAWMWERIDAGLKLAFRQHPAVRARLDALTAQVAAGDVAASTAARSLLSLYAERMPPGQEQ
ncbi:MAG: methylmalonyl Co-A mutase-associated GTPase MeaB [Burkholderiales bacterium]|nr:methylmalonyl Co-A mutase-associated GTPase MeaB [Burkholderiales bacterium]